MKIPALIRNPFTALTLLILPSISHAAGGSPSEFEGVVQFEARKTVVPMVICEDLPGHCPVPQPYWTLSVHEARGEHVEWTAPLAFGVPRKPESLEVQGKEIRPGDRIRIRGEARRLSSHWYFVDEIEDLEVL